MELLKVIGLLLTARFSQQKPELAEQLSLGIHKMALALPLRVCARMPIFRTFKLVVLKGTILLPSIYPPGLVALMLTKHSVLIISRL